MCIVVSFKKSGICFQYSNTTKFGLRNFCRITLIVVVGVVVVGSRVLAVVEEVVEILLLLVVI